eukprot:CAMPEP_0206148524 /NCGR_PEP_ID=MMETSP1473-20131121/36860_1 /ASSEMBLY_ACC=CAM_ASM_001109 /TAXON_ID=1461547 /ORGANISM="Stichococcus sp, Strain RCC1054" /LENGTH=163 /DNA_ID=CAMNT_0053545885 /DNA_START=567 /DNA_END=1059 /DNA_ORIENTATION=-
MVALTDCQRVGSLKYGEANVAGMAGVWHSAAARCSGRKLFDILQDPTTSCSGRSVAVTTSSGAASGPAGLPPQQLSPLFADSRSDWASTSRAASWLSSCEGGMKWLPSSQRAASRSFKISTGGCNITKRTCAGLSAEALVVSTSRYLRFSAEHANTAGLSLEA